MSSVDRQLHDEAMYVGWREAIEQQVTIISAKPDWTNTQWQVEMDAMDREVAELQIRIEKIRGRQYVLRRKINNLDWKAS